jgi:hypothetical protein
MTRSGNSPQNFTVAIEGRGQVRPISSATRGGSRLSEWRDVPVLDGSIVQLHFGRPGALGHQRSSVLPEMSEVGDLLCPTSREDRVPLTQRPPPPGGPGGGPRPAGPGAPGGIKSGYSGFSMRLVPAVPARWCIHFCWRRVFIAIADPSRSWNVAESGRLDTRWGIHSSHRAGFAPPSAKHG